jgi:hypothetical protein
VAGAGRLLEAAHLALGLGHYGALWLADLGAAAAYLGRLRGAGSPCARARLRAVGAPELPA